MKSRKPTRIRPAIFRIPSRLRAEGGDISAWKQRQTEDFIHLLKRTVTQEDFKNGVCSLPFQILSENLHGGRNYGAVFVTAAGETHKISIFVTVGGEKAQKRISFREDLRNYMELRLQYEALAEPSYESGGEGEEEQEDNQTRQTGRKKKKPEVKDERTLSQRRLASSMGRLLSQMKISYEDSAVRLLEAEHLLAVGRRDRAQAILDSVREQILAERDSRVMNYLLFQYIQVSLSGGEAQRDALLRLLRRHLGGRAGKLLFIYDDSPSGSGAGRQPGRRLCRSAQTIQRGSRQPVPVSGSLQNSGEGTGVSEEYGAL